MNPEPNQFSQTQKANTPPLSSASVNATPLKEFTDFDTGDLANILHDLRDTVRNLSQRMNTGLTPAAAGNSFARRNGNIPSPISIPKYPAAAPGPFTKHDQPPHISLQPGSKYVPPHRNSQHPSRYYNASFPEQPLREPIPLQSIRFSSACVELETFLLDIREQLQIFKNCFASDKARINWVADHF